MVSEWTAGVTRRDRKPKNGQPRLGISQPGLSFFLLDDLIAIAGFSKFGKRTYKPNSVVCGHSSRRRVAADTHQRPTRRFHQLLEPIERIGQMRSAAWLFANASLPIWSCSVWGLPCPRRYRRSGALLPHHFTLTPALRPQAAPGLPSRKRGSRGGIFSVALAVHGL